MPTIDPLDRQFILLLNGMACDARRLCEITNNLDAFKAFLGLLHARQIELDRAVELAMRRAGIVPVIASCAGCYSAGRAEGYQRGWEAAERQATA